MHDRSSATGPARAAPRPTRPSSPARPTRADRRRGGGAHRPGSRRGQDSPDERWNPPIRMPRRPRPLPLSALLATLLLLLSLAGARGLAPGTGPTSVGATPAAPVAVDNPRPAACPPPPGPQGGADHEPDSPTGTFPWPSTGDLAHDHTPPSSPPVR